MSANRIREILVVGAGTSGQQIGLQFARFGYAVTIYDVEPSQFAECRRRQQEILSELARRGRLRPVETDEVLARVAYAAEPVAAAENADLLCESVPEDLELKRAVFARFHRLCKPETIFTTNTSYLLPSRMAAATGRPDRFAAYHFHVPVWLAAAVDVMPHPGTSPEVVETLCDLAGRIGQVPIRCRRENHGYVFNAMLHPLLVAALDLAARGVAGFEDVDRAWMAVTGMPVGPFGILDTIGIDTVHGILEQWARWFNGPQIKAASALLQEQLDRGDRGIKNGRGFYRYPNPAFAQPGFLTVEREAAAPMATMPAADHRKARFVPVTVAAPVRVRHEFRPQGGALLLGDGPPADALDQALRAAGATVLRVPSSIHPSQAAEWFGETWSRSAMPHLFLAPGGHDGLAGRGAVMGAAVEDTLGLPFFLTQAWFQRIYAGHLADHATLLAVVQLGGTFGWNSPPEQPLGGGLAGLVKAVSMESMARGEPGLQAKVLDFDSSFSPVERAGLALFELALAQAAVVTGDRAECRRRHADIEIAYAAGARHVVRYRDADGALAKFAPSQLPRGTWLVSGGGRGITLECAVALGRRFGVELCLLGRTPLAETDYLAWSPEQIADWKSQVMRSAFHSKQRPNEAWQPYANAIELQRALHRCRDAGLQAEYRVCDVAGAAAVRAVVRQLDDAGKPVRGVLHGAGIEATARLEAKTLEAVRATLAPKIAGTEALIWATEDQPLEWFIAFGSLSGRFGGIGQADYSLANDAMAKLVGSLRRRRPECRSLVIDWPGWEGVGMAARPEGRYMLRRRDHALMPVEEGIAHLVACIEAGAPWPEVVVVGREELGADFHAGPGQQDDRHAQ